MTAAAALPGTAASPISTGHRNVGQRLVAAFAKVERFPAQAHARDQLLAALDASAPIGETVLVVESDPAIALAALRLAGARRQDDDPVSGIPEAMASIPSSDLRQLAAALPTRGPLCQCRDFGSAGKHFRRHGTATLRAAERLTALGHAHDPDELRAAALLHDIGKLVLLHSHGAYHRGGEGTPSDRLLAEGRTHGLDHAVVGGVLARRLGLPPRIATLIERHHSHPARGDVAVLRLADMLAHEEAGDPVDAAEFEEVAAALGIKDAPTALILDPPGPDRTPGRPLPSPLSRQQTAAIRLMARGARGKEVAAKLGITPSTVRSHLFAAYKRLGVADRTQAILLATERGWL